ncbi:MAG: hypothetical protein HDT28_06070 [Clostridiales bacterium]|nr:hypothetical protein [Clostridiales bacterium]
MYIEFVIADNFLLTYLAASAAARLAHKAPCVWRNLLASLVGTVVAVFYPFMRLNATTQILVKLALWGVLSVMLFVKTPRAVLSGLMFLGATFAFGGASYAVGLALYGNTVAAQAFSLKYPLFLTLGTAAVVYTAVRYCISKMRLKRAREPYEYGIEVTAYGSTMKFSAFLDTGNSVFDPTTGLPIIITDVDRFTQKLDGAAAVEFVKTLPRLRKTSIGTAAGSTDIFIIKPTAITVYTDRQAHKINAMIGLVGGRSFTKEHELLLNPVAISEVVC